MAYSFTELLTGKTEVQLLTELLAGLKAKGLPITDWAAGAPVRTILEHAFAPLGQKFWKLVGILARGGLIRLAQALAEEDLATWEATPEATFLYQLAVDLYQVTPWAPQFTEGTERFVNSSATAYTLTSATILTTGTGLRYRLAEAAPVPLPGGATVWVKIRAESPGGSYNVAAGAIDRLVTSLPGVAVSNQPNPPATGWITLYGTPRETPLQVANRCVVRWARLTKLQALVSDGFVSLALDSHQDVRKVAVWSNYSHLLGGIKANSVTLYLGGDAGPVAPAVALAVQIAMGPYIGIHDRLEVQPCALATYAPTGVVSVSKMANLSAVKAAVEQNFVAWKAQRQIGELVLAWQVRVHVKVDGVVNFVDTLADYTPPKNALVDFDLVGLIYQVV